MIAIPSAEPRFERQITTFSCRSDWAARLGLGSGDSRQVKMIGGLTALSQAMCAKRLSAEAGSITSRSYRDVRRWNSAEVAHVKPHDILGIHAVDLHPVVADDGRCVDGYEGGSPGGMRRRPRVAGGTLAINGGLYGLRSIAFLSVAAGA